MKTKIIFSLLILLSVFLQSCQKEKTIYEGYFYTNDATLMNKTLSLNINGEQKGALPYISVSTTTSSDSIIEFAYHFSLPNGEYDLEVKDDKENIWSSHTLKIRSNFLSEQISTSGGIGGLNVSGTEGIMIVNFFDSVD